QREHLDPQLVGREPGGVAGALVLDAEIRDQPGEPDGDRREQDVERDVQPELGAGEEEGIVHCGANIRRCRTQNRPSSTTAGNGAHSRSAWRAWRTASASPRPVTGRATSSRG